MTVRRPSDDAPGPTCPSAIYPGSFDPLTNGHLSIIRRGLRMFDELIVAVANNSRKKALFTAGGAPRAHARGHARTRGWRSSRSRGCSSHYARDERLRAILRGLRAVSDFEYEFQLTNMNRKLDPEFDTVFMMTGRGQLLHLVAAGARGGLAGRRRLELVPPNVFKALQEKFPSKNGG